MMKKTDDSTVRSSRTAEMVVLEVVVVVENRPIFFVKN
jgi:hypothetical protein